MGPDNVAYGQCRCCLSKGNHRDIMKEYNYNGAKEVYFDVFLECFNLFLSTNSCMGTLICSNCVSRLRDASNFKLLVLSTENKLMQTVNNIEMMFVNVPTEHSDRTNIKAEPQNTVVKKEPMDIDNYSNHSDEDRGISDRDEDPPPTTNQLEVDVCNELVDGEAELLSRFERKSLRLPTRTTLYTTCKNYVKHLDKLKGKVILPKMIEELLKNTQKKTLARKSFYVTEKVALVNNASTILEYSNAVPFKPKTCHGIPCYYCRKICENRTILQEHQKNEHENPNYKRMFSKYGSECLVVYVDITELQCNICKERISNLNELKTHLISKHKKKYYHEFPDRVIPFKLDSKNGYECQICGFNFETFGSVERHMNIHYRNYVCEECGTGFVTKHRLKVHIKYTHECGSFPCEICKKVYNTQQKYRSHFDAIHRMVKKNKCPKCPLKFADYFVRQKHMEEEHGVAPLQYKCNVCDKNFNRRYALSCHMKRSHLEDKSIQCQLCSYKCYTNSELKFHMIKHNGERTFECQVCRKSYARKKTLKEHMRIHNNDRRFVCIVCGQAFVQNCSLKGHMKTHHQDYLHSLPV